VRKRALFSLVGALIAAVALVSASGAATTKARKVTRIDVSTRVAVVHYLRSIHVNPKGAVIQRGALNYAGANCPGRGWTCASTRHTVVQIAKRGGQNRFTCRSKKCVVVQLSGVSHGIYTRGRQLASTAATGGGSNATCIKNGSGNGSGQTCTISQSGVGPNTAVVWQNSQKVAGLTNSVVYSASITQTATGGGLSQGNTACVTQTINLDGSTTGLKGKPVTVSLEAHQGVTIQQNAAGSAPNTAVNGAKLSGTTAVCDSTTLAQNQTVTSTVNATAAVQQSENATSRACPDTINQGDNFNLCLEIDQNQGQGYKDNTHVSGANAANFAQTNSLTAIANASSGAVTQTQSSLAGGLVGTLNQYSKGLSTASASQSETECEDASKNAGLTQCDISGNDGGVQVPASLTQNQYGPEGVGKLPKVHGKRRQLYKTEKGFGQSTQTGNTSDTFTVGQTSTQYFDPGSAGTRVNTVEGDCITAGSCTAGQTTNVNNTKTKDGYTSPSISGLRIDCSGNSQNCQPTPPPTPVITQEPPSTNYSSSGVFEWTDTATGGITFLCNVDGIGFSATNCVSGNSFTNTYGDHSFQVEAKDNGGNTAATTEYDWTNVPPTPTIDSGPGPTTSPDASFTFSDTDTSLSFVCSLDGSSYSACSSGQTYNALDPGSHTFLVKATDLALPTPHLSAAASTTWTLSSDNPNVLIAGAGDSAFAADNSPSAAEPNDNIASALTAAGYTVTEAVALPADLSGFGQVWWVDSDPPTAGEQDQLVAFAESGGGVFLTGEWQDFGANLNAADQTMVNSIVSAGGVTLGGAGCCAATPVAYSVNSGVVGKLATAPHTITTWTPTYPGLISGIAASSVFASDSPTEVAAAAWNRGSTVGEGRLVVFMDINWAQAAWAGANFSDVAENVAFYLSGLSSPPPPPIAPALKFGPLAPISVGAGIGTSRTGVAGRSASGK
jgi:hypothetical protein